LCTKKTRRQSTPKAYEARTESVDSIGGALGAYQVAGGSQYVIGVALDDEIHDPTPFRFSLRARLHEYDRHCFLRLLSLQKIDRYQRFQYWGCCGGLGNQLARMDQEQDHGPVFEGPRETEGFDRR
jgi:hypothetical protein